MLFPTPGVEPLAPGVQPGYPTKAYLIGDEPRDEPASSGYGKEQHRLCSRIVLFVRQGLRLHL